MIWIKYLRSLLVVFLPSVIYNIATVLPEHIEHGIIWSLLYCCCQLSWLIAPQPAVGTCMHTCTQQYVSPHALAPLPGSTVVDGLLLRGLNNILLIIIADVYSAFTLCFSPLCASFALPHIVFPTILKEIFSRWWNRDLERLNRVSEAMSLGFKPWLPSPSSPLCYKVREAIHKS